MPSAHFSSAILAGMRSQGLSDADVVRITGLSPETLKKVAGEEADFSDGVLDRIERETGKTAGQLAALSFGPGAESLTALMDLWAEVRLGRSESPATSSERGDAVAGSDHENDDREKLATRR